MRVGKGTRRNGRKQNKQKKRRRRRKKLKSSSHRSTACNFDVHQTLLALLSSFSFIYSSSFDVRSTPNSCLTLWTVNGNCWKEAHEHTRHIIGSMTYSLDCELLCPAAAVAAVVYGWIGYMIEDMCAYMCELVRVPKSSEFSFIWIIFPSKRIFTAAFCSFCFFLYELENERKIKQKRIAAAAARFLFFFSFWAGNFTSTVLKWTTFRQSTYSGPCNVNLCSCQRRTRLAYNVFFISFSHSVLSLVHSFVSL